MGGRSALLGCRLAALAAGLLLLSSRPSLRAVTAGAALLTPVLGGIGAVGNLGGTLLGHAFVLERLVLLLVLDVGRLAGHHALLPPSSITDVPLGAQPMLAAHPGKAHRCASRRRRSGSTMDFNAPGSGRPGPPPT